MGSPDQHGLPAEGIDVDPAAVAELHREGAVQLIDVREDYEWEAGRIAGARHIELQAVAAEAGSLDREKPVVFYCRVGGRSAMAAGAFRGAGFAAYSMEGGIEAWDEAGLPLEPDDGEVADH
jgi:rhodanese-related sulfurtransferase